MFTSQLGTSSSQLGSIVLGFGAAFPIYATSASNVLTQTQTLALNKSVTVLAFSNYNPAHTLFMNKVLNLDVSNSLVQTHAAIVDKINPASSVMSYSQSLVIELRKRAVSVLELDQIVTPEMVYLRTAPTYFEYYQTLGLVKNQNVSSSNALALSQAVVCARVKGASSVLNLSQTVDVTNSKASHSNYTLTQDVVVQVSHAITVTNNLRHFSDVTKTTVKSYRASNALGMGSFVKKWKVFDLAPDNVLNLSNDALSGERFFPTGDPSTLVFSQTAHVQKVITLSAGNTLNLSSVVSRNIVKKESVNNTLTFLHSRTIYIPIGNIGSIQVPNLIITNVHPANVPAPLTNGVKFNIGQTPKRVPPYCVLQVPEQAITLPAPEFNDSESYSGLFTIRRSMIGGTRTYVHRVNTSKLKYDFVIGVPKSLELENYLLNYNSRVHYLTNWKGELWYVFITNNPMETVAKSRYSNGEASYDDLEKMLITLEFEGCRVH